MKLGHTSEQQSKQAKIEQELELIYKKTNPTTTPSKP
jgi:hypothetical protein